MTVAVIQDKAVWDAFVDDSPYGTLFHKWDFLSIIEKYSGSKLYRYGIFKNDELLCIFPIFCKNRMRIMKMASSPPPSTGIQYLGPIVGLVYESARQYQKEQFLTTIVEEMDAEFKRLSVNHISINTVPGFLDTRPFLWNGYDVSPSYTYVMDLRPPLEEIWDGFGHSHKKKIKAQEKEQLSTIEVEDPQEIYEIMEKRNVMMKKRLDDIRTPYDFPSPGFLKEIAEAYRDNMKFYITYNKNNEIRGIDAVYMYKSHFTLFMGGMKGHDNEYLSYKFIKQAKSAGFITIENMDADTRRMTPFKSRYNYSLRAGYNIKKMSNLLSIAALFYRSLPAFIKF
jgi:hypothetical protein